MARKPFLGQSYLIILEIGESSSRTSLDTCARSRLEDIENIIATTNGDTKHIAIRKESKCIIIGCIFNLCFHCFNIGSISSLRDECFRKNLIRNAGALFVHGHYEFNCIDIFWLCAHIFCFLPIGKIAKFCRQFLRCSGVQIAALVQIAHRIEYVFWGSLDCVTMICFLPWVA